MTLFAKYMPFQVILFPIYYFYLYLLICMRFLFIWLVCPVEIYVVKFISPVFPYFTCRCHYRDSHSLVQQPLIWQPGGPTSCYNNFQPFSLVVLGFPHCTDCELPLSLEGDGNQSWISNFDSSQGSLYFWLVANCLNTLLGWEFVYKCPWTLTS